MNMQEYEKVLPKLGEKVDATLLVEIGLLREENEMLRDIIKINQKRIENFDELFADVFEEIKIEHK